MTAGTTVLRVSAATHDALQELARQDHVSMQEVLGHAVEAYRRERLIAATNDAYAALRSNGPAWREFQDEMAGLDGRSERHAEGHSERVSVSLLAEVESRWMDDCAINDEDGAKTLFIGGLLTSSGGQAEVNSPSRGTAGKAPPGCSVLASSSSPVNRPT
ncbi:MAG: hypothetical protein M3Z66_18795 [Chloroflexota bacterium]|nr:hypothetical protein [Chloroflexota bacterium]